nr:M3 family peptidase [Thermoanaerobaculia bacterium]
MPTPLLSSLGLVALLATAPATPDNPLLRPWTGPYGGVPPFAAVKVAQFKPALEAAMAEQLAAVDAIAKDPAPPTFQNTLAALERSGRTLERVFAVYGVFCSTMSTPEFQAVELEMAPVMAGFF